MPMGSNTRTIKPTLAVIVAAGLGFLFVPNESTAQGTPPPSTCVNPCWFVITNPHTGHQTDPTCPQNQPWRWKKIQCHRYECVGPSTDPPTNYYYTFDVIETGGCFSSGAAVTCPNSGCAPGP